MNCERIHINEIMDVEEAAQIKRMCRNFCQTEVRNGTGERLIEVSGERGFIDMGIQRFSMVEQVILTHRRKCHMSEIFNKMEDIIDT